MPLQENRRKTHTRNTKWSEIFFIFQPRTTSNQVNSCFQLRSLSKPTKKKEVTIKKPTFHPTRKSVSPNPETKHVSTKKLTVKPVTPAQATFKAVSRAKETTKEPHQLMSPARNEKCESRAKAVSSMFADHEVAGPLIITTLIISASKSA